MSDFGDVDPEDAWHRDDPLPLLVRNLIRRVAALVAVAGLDAAVHRRLALLRDDLAHVLERIEAQR